LGTVTRVLKQIDNRDNKERLIQKQTIKERRKGREIKKE
jgi:hypothetical protein